jgi:hypothetical protein
VTHIGVNDDGTGTIRVEWTDAENVARATSVTPEDFAKFFPATTQEA